VAKYLVDMTGPISTVCVVDKNCTCATVTK